MCASYTTLKVLNFPMLDNCNRPKIQIKQPNHNFVLKDANGMANSKDPNQAAPLGAPKGAV